MLKITYYLDVVSSWCFYAEPVWADLKRRYEGIATFEWKIAVIPHEGLPRSEEEELRYFRRSGVITGQLEMLKAGWVDPTLEDYTTPNLVAEAAKDFGVTDDRARLALSEAALRRGERIGDLTFASCVVADACGLNQVDLEIAAKSAKVAEQVRRSNEEFRSLQVTQRPTFQIISEIDDRAVFSGLVRSEPLLATIEAMLKDVRAYRSWSAHFDS